MGVLSTLEKFFLQNTTRKLNELETRMSALTDALDRAAARIAEDFANLQDLLERALATESAASAEAQQLRDELASMQADTQQVISALNALDPDPAYPATPGEPQE